MCHWLRTGAGAVVSKSSVEHVVCSNYLNEDIKRKIDEFDNMVANIMADNKYLIAEEPGFQGMFLDNSDDEVYSNLGMARNDNTTLTDAKYDDMITGK
jgi:uncharacterized protein YacL (UPF0231 family)